MKKQVLIFSQLSKSIQSLDKSPFLMLSALYSLYFYDPIGSAAFWWLMKEDGLIEYLTAATFMIAAILFGRRLLDKKQQPKHFYLLAKALSAACIFISLEEISYGQRIFGYSVDVVEKINHQGEITLHNLSIIQPHLIAITSIIFFAFAIAAITNNSQDRKLPPRQDFLYFGVPFAYYAFGMIIKVFLLYDLVRAPLGNQEVFEFIFAVGMLKYSHQFAVTRARPNVNADQQRIKIRD